MFAIRGWLLRGHLNSEAVVGAVGRETERPVAGGSNPGDNDTILREKG